LTNCERANSIFYHTAWYCVLGWHRYSTLLNLLACMCIQLAHIFAKSWNHCKSLLREHHLNNVYWCLEHNITQEEPWSYKEFEIDNESMPILQYHIYFNCMAHRLDWLIGWLIYIHEGLHYIILCKTIIANVWLVIKLVLFLQWCRAKLSTL